VIVVDTSVWIDHLRGSRRAAGLGERLDDGEVLVHPWVVGELALGHLGPDPQTILGDLRTLPAAPTVAEDEVTLLIEARALAGSGIGWVDAQLLASALTAGAGLWTSDRRLGDVAASLGLASGGSPALRIR
jgi:predicted nucleic acid-binding protein